MTKIIEMPSGNGKRQQEANDFAKQNILEALGRQQLQWVQYFEVLIKGLAHDPNCQYCKGPDGKGRGYVAINFITPPKGKGVAQGYYQLQFCRCAAIPEGMDPNIMYQWMQQLDRSINDTSRYIYRHTFWGMFVWIGMSIYGYMVDAAIWVMEKLAKLTEPKKQSTAMDEQPVDEKEMFTGGAGQVPTEGRAPDATSAETL